jgi:DNA-binding helix-hairpin-helix protein with protein kinase domain
MSIFRAADEGRISMILYNRGLSLEIEDPVHAGGEGLICPVKNQPSKLAKIYKSQSRTGRETKLRWMLANAPDDPGRSIGHASIAWPEFLLYDRQGAFMGFVMPRIPNARMLLQVFNPHLRIQSSMDCDGFFLHRVARNLSAAVGALHARDYIIGDLNECNILVTSKALVTVIDTDSFQVREEHEGQIIFYPCPVGRPEYTSPELHGTMFKGQVRQPEQDAFALGVLIFQILLGGNHPFRSIWRGQDMPPPIEEKIRLGLFPYDRTSRNTFVAPPHNVSFDKLYPPLADLFLRCFVEGHGNYKRRPLPSEWERVLMDAEKSLQMCTNRHVYSGHLKRCPECNTNPLPMYPPKANPLPVQPAPVTGQPAPVPVTVPFFGARTCTRCGTSVPTYILFCPNCASAIHPKACKYCGFMNVPDGGRCCPKCGKPT